MLKPLIPPRAPKYYKELTVHHHTRIDNYYWLNERGNPEVIDYLEDENNYAYHMLRHTEALQDTIYQEIISRIKQEDQSVPYLDNGYLYATRYEHGQEYPIYDRTAMATGQLETMLNVNELATGHKYFQVGGRSVSPDNKVLAYGEDTVSRRIYTLRFKNLSTGEWMEDSIPNTTGLAVWADDNRTVFYVLKDAETLRGNKVLRHRLGTGVDQDVVVFHEEDDTFNIHVFKSRSKKFIIITSSTTVSDECHILESSNPDGAFRLFQPRERNVEYSIDHLNGHFYIRTNWLARNFRLMKSTEVDTIKERWQEVIPHRESVLLEAFDLFNAHLVSSERVKGITQLRIISWDGTDDHYIQFSEEVYVATASINKEPETAVFRLGYTSLTTPGSTFDYNMRTRELTLLKQEEVLGGFEAGNYHSERLYIKARDGVEVPVSMVYRKGYQKNGTSPLLLYGYGSYGISVEPFFNSARLSLLDRGFAIAIAHIRGGQEMGRHWYEEGKLLKKKNTFYDFIDCADYLITQGYCAANKLFAMGGSAGGLLMGAVINMRPDLWRAVIAAVPFVDVVTTMLDSSIPLTTFEYDEWGNPEEKEYYDYMLGYSPYDNVEPKNYPALLVTTGLHDSQVQYWEPAKWVAKLREMKTDGNPLILRTNMETGHSGASGRFAMHKETAMEYAFLVDLSK